MKVVSGKSGAVVCAECETAADGPSRTVGLMFAGKRKNIFFIFDRDGKHPIHSFFVPYDFHAVYLDEKMRVVDLHASVKPFTPWIESRKPARYLLEIGDAEGAMPKIGEVLECSDGKS